MIIFLKKTQNYSRVFLLFSGRCRS